MSTPCRSCSAPIIWCVTTNGKRIPLDEAPVPNGTMLIHRETFRAPVLAVHFSKAAEQGIPIPSDGKKYVSHFATCPNATKHRKTK